MKILFALGLALSTSVAVVAARVEGSRSFVGHYQPGARPD
jgi:hypothetical protein